MKPCTETQKVLCGVRECETCFKRSFASDERIRWWSTKNTCDPWQVIKGSDKSMILICPNCKHELIIRINHINPNVTACGFCQKNTRRLCNDDGCKSCYERSFASHPFANQWSTDNKVSPRHVAKRSVTKYHFVCHTCHHKYEAALHNMRDTGNCHYCKIGNYSLCTNDNCDLCFNRSFASHACANEWSIDNLVPARLIAKHSATIRKFDCRKCSHKYETTLNNMRHTGNCPYCRLDNRVLCTDDNCILCFKNSFASHEKSKYWSNKNTISARMAPMSKYSLYYWILCIKCGHESNSMVRSIINGDGCKYCLEGGIVALCENANCDHCFNRSFASYSFSRFWDPINDVI